MKMQEKYLFAIHFHIIIFKKREINIKVLISLQAVDKCRNCMSQQPVLMRKSAENVII